MPCTRLWCDVNEAVKGTANANTMGLMEASDSPKLGPSSPKPCSA